MVHLAKLLAWIVGVALGYLDVGVILHACTRTVMYVWTPTWCIMHYSFTSCDECERVRTPGSVMWKLTAQEIPQAIIHLPGSPEFLSFMCCVLGS
jgi:hypothetical protein